MPVSGGDERPDPGLAKLMDVVRAASSGASRMIVVIGAPGRTGPAVAQAAHLSRGGWQEIWTPRGPAELIQGLRGTGRPRPAPWTMVVLADLTRFLLPETPELAAAVASALRGALADARLRPLLVLAALTPGARNWDRLVRPAASGQAGPWAVAAAQARALLHGATVLALATAAPVPSAPVPTVAVPSPAVPSPAVPSPAVPTWLAAAAEPAHAEPVDAEAADAEPVGASASQTAEPETGASEAAEPETDARPEPAPDEAPPETEPLAAEPITQPAPGTAAPGTAVAPDAEVAPRAGSAGWTPSAVLLPVDVPEPPDAARWRGVLREASGDVAGAERLYERAAIGGDLEALDRLGRLRDVVGHPAGVAGFVDQAIAEGNTAVLFTLAASGEPRALAELTRLRGEDADAADACGEDAGGTEEDRPQGAGPDGG